MMWGNMQDALRRRGIGVMGSGSKDQRNVGVRALLRNDALSLIVGFLDFS